MRRYAQQSLRPDLYRKNPGLVDPGFAVQGRQESLRLDQAHRIYADIPHGAGIDGVAGEQAVMLV